jgi:hypothetical protein
MKPAKVVELLGHSLVDLQEVVGTPERNLDGFEEEMEMLELHGYSRDCFQEELVCSPECSPEHSLDNSEQEMLMLGLVGLCRDALRVPSLSQGTNLMTRNLNSYLSSYVNFYFWKAFEESGPNQKHSPVRQSM